MNDMEHPEDRAGFRYPDLKGHVLEQRAQLVASALTLLRAYIVAGMPKHGFPEKGSFVAWDALVRGAILWAADADPCGGIRKLRKESDSDLDKLRRLVGAWLENPDLAAGATVAELIQRSMAEADHAVALRTAIAEYADPRRPSPDPKRPIDSTVLGHRLKALYKRPVTVDGVVYTQQRDPRHAVLLVLDGNAEPNVLRVCQPRSSRSP